MLFTTQNVKRITKRLKWDLYLLRGLFNPTPGFVYCCIGRSDFCLQRHIRNRLAGISRSEDISSPTGWSLQLGWILQAMLRNSTNSVKQLLLQKKNDIGINGYSIFGETTEKAKTIRANASEGIYLLPVLYAAPLGFFSCCQGPSLFLLRIDDL